MIRGLHGLLYSSEPEAARDYLRDKVKLPSTDIGGGWMIFDLPESDLGVHPVEAGQQGGAHDVSFYCDDIQGTVADMKARGVEFDGEIADHGYGFVTHFTIPGGIRVQLYEPKYQKRAAKPARAEKAAPRRVGKMSAARKPAAKKKAPARAGSRTAAPKRAAARKGKTAKKRR